MKDLQVREDALMLLQRLIKELMTHSVLEGTFLSFSLFPDYPPTLLVTGLSPIRDVNQLAFLFRVVFPFVGRFSFGFTDRVTVRLIFVYAGFVLLLASRLNILLWFAYLFI